MNVDSKAEHGEGGKDSYLCVYVALHNELSVMLSYNSACNV